MRSLLLFASTLLAGCAGVSSIPYDPRPMGQASVAGAPYFLPKGVISVDVISDENGIAVTVGEVELVSDHAVGMLVARIKPSPFNDEIMTVGVDQSTGFLNSVSTESTAQLAAILEESAKLAGRLTLQNAKLSFFQNKTKYLTERFDPLDPQAVANANRNINMAIARAAQIDAGQTAGAGWPDVRISLDDIAPSSLQPGPATLPNCPMGVCVRAMTIRTVRIEVGSVTMDTKTVKLPSREIIPLPVPQTILSDQKINIKIKDGMYDSYTLDRKSEVYGLVHAVGGIPGAFVQGVLGGLGDTESVAKKEKEVITAQKELRDAKAEAAKTSIELQNKAFPTGGNAYRAGLTTVYPFPTSQRRALMRQRNTPPPVTASPRENEFTDQPKR